MTTETLTLSQFLLERIAEDEKVARGAMALFHRNDPARVLATCKAHRAIVEGYETYASQSAPSDQAIARTLATTLRALASIYADHPDYQESWRV